MKLLAFLLGMFCPGVGPLILKVWFNADSQCFKWCFFGSLISIIAVVGFMIFFVCAVS